MNTVRLMLVMALLTLLNRGAEAAEPPLVIRSGFTVSTSGYGPLVLEKKDILRHYGTSYVLEPAHFRSTSLELSALAAGEVDIISIAYSTLAIAVLNAGMTDIRVVADGGQDGVDGHRTVPFLVRNDSAITRIEDLKGKAIASNGAGGAYDVAMRWMLRRHGIEDKRDYTVIETDYANMSAMLLSKKVDLIIGAEPFVDTPAMRSGAHPLFTTLDALGPSQMTVMATRAGFIAQNRARLVDFFEDMMTSIRWYHDPAHHDEAVAIVARVTRQPPEDFASYLFTARDFYRDLSLRPDLDSLQRNIAVMRALGFIKGDVDVRSYADLSLIDDAVRRLP